MKFIVGTTLVTSGFYALSKAAEMVRSKHVRREVGKFSYSGTFGIASLVLLLGGGLSWAGPPNLTASDAAGNTAGGTNAVVNNPTGIFNTGFGWEALSQNTTIPPAAGFRSAAILRPNIIPRPV